ncbi:MAG TPA: ABC transporter substrate-binding protein [Candidatus Babeliales bacterium]|nr:ABC transporter substrate-binding protein [Candidatus Babeliales bacterium]
MKKLFIIAALAITFIASFTVIKQIHKTTPTAAYTIGILQTASHPALDAARDGFIQELTNIMGDTVAFVIQNAQGSVTQAHTIAQQFHTNKKYTGFFAIATPATQALSAVEKKRPIFIAAVTDPNALGIIHPTTNVCGTNDMVDVPATIKMLKQLLPQAKTVGILYTSGELNSITLAEQMRQELAESHVTALDFAVSSEADIAAIVELACRKSDVILAPTDNTVASSIALVTSLTKKHKKPIIACDNTLVAAGALAARGVDYMLSGKQTAHIAYQVLIEGKKTYALPIEQALTDRIFVNKHYLDELNITIPEAIKNLVHVIDQ